MVPFLINARLNLDKLKAAKVWEDWFPISRRFEIAQVTQNGFVLEYKGVASSRDDRSKL